DFLRALPSEWLKNHGYSFQTVTEAADSHQVKDRVDMPHTVTWADTERDLTAWLGNSMQHQAVLALYSLEDQVLECGDEKLIDDWRKLTTSDHFYYMSTKFWNDGDVHAYF